MPRHHRTSRIVMVARLGLITWMIVSLFFLFIGIVPGIGIFAVVIGTITLFMFFASVVVRIGGWLLYGDDPDYREWLANGGDPYFDVLPAPINTDPWIVRAGGIPEPATDFMPPADWMFQCMNCGARNPNDACMCWYCGLGLVREITCAGCGGTFRETAPGDLVIRGVICPRCGAVVRIG